MEMILDNLDGLSKGSWRQDSKADARLHFNDEINGQPCVEEETFINGLNGELTHLV